MLPLGGSSHVLVFLALNAAAQTAVPVAVQQIFLTHKAGEPLSGVASASEVQRGCPLPCADSSSIAVYRAEIDAAGRELGLNTDDLRRAEQNYIPDGVPRKRAAADAETDASRRLQAAAVAQLLADPHVSPEAKQKLADRMQSIARALGGLQTTDGTEAAVALGPNGGVASVPVDGKLPPRAQLPSGFKAFSSEPPPMLSMRELTVMDKIKAIAQTWGLSRGDEKRVPVSTLNQVPDGCQLFMNLTNQPCENGDAILLRGDNDAGELRMIRKSLAPGENGDMYSLSMPGNRLVTRVEISDEQGFGGTEAEAFTVYHELTHIKMRKDIAALFGGSYPSGAAMTDELLTNDAEEQQYVKKHPDILTMAPPSNDFDMTLWARARVRTGPVNLKSYDDDLAAFRKLQKICEDAPGGEPCGGAETTHAHLKRIYEKRRGYGASSNLEVREKLDAFLGENVRAQDAYYATIRENAKKACAENWTDGCKRITD